MQMAPEAKLFSAKMPLFIDTEGGILKQWVMVALEALIPLVIANPDLRFVMNNSWASGCLREDYH